MDFKLEDGFTIISRTEGQIGIYYNPYSSRYARFREESEMVQMEHPPQFCWELDDLGVLRPSEFEVIAMLYPQYFNKVSLAAAYKIARRDGLAVVNINYPTEQWR